MSTRTKKLLITLGCVSLFAFGSFFQEFRNRKFVNAVVQQAHEQITLVQFDQLNTQLQMCVMSANGKIFQYLRTNEPADAALAGLIMEKCDEWLDVLGKNAPNEKTSAFLGQARLFFGGFREAANNIILRQTQLEELYGNGMNLIADPEKLIRIKKLEEEQSKSLPEFNKFTSAIFLSIIQVDPFNTEDDK